MYNQPIEDQHAAARSINPVLKSIEHPELDALFIKEIRCWSSNKGTEGETTIDCRTFLSLAVGAPPISWRWRDTMLLNFASFDTLAGLRLEKSNYNLLPGVLQ